jgi:HSP20 family protein
MKNGEVVVGREHSMQPSVADEQYRVPAADVYETADAFVLMLDLPGAKRESIHLTLEKGEMRVRAELESERTEQESYLLNETESAGFFRVFSIGEGIDTSNVDAHFEQGVLTVKLFKSEELKPREIRIH